MTWYEGLAIASGLAIGYWLVSVFTAPRDPDADAPEKPVGPSNSDVAEAPWHEVMGVSEWATEEQVTAAYRDRVGQYHPDKVATMGPEIRVLAERKTRELNDAYRQFRRRH